MTNEERRALDLATLEQLGDALLRRVEREAAVDPAKGRAMMRRILSKMKESLDRVGYPVPENMLELMAQLEAHPESAPLG